jgi:hypothetical protein
MRMFSWFAIAAALFLAPLTAEAKGCPGVATWAASHAAAAAGHIADGHAWTKHKAEYHGSAITTDAQFKALVEKIMKTPGVAISDGRHKWWDATHKTIVIFNPKADDCGTAFVPTAGKSYYDNQN